MRLPSDSGSVIMRDRIQWTRCGFEHAALADAVVTLAPLARQDHDRADDTPFAGGFAGLAFDRHCRVFHPGAGAGAIEYELWGRQDALGVHVDAARPFEFTAARAGEDGFGPAADLPKRALALACDEADYLYVADPDTPAVWLVDTWQHEVARRIDTAGRPLDLCRGAGGVYVLLDTPGWLRVGPCDLPRPLPWLPGLGAADRLEVRADGHPFVLLGAGTAAAMLASLRDPVLRLAVPFCTDFLVGPEDPALGWPFVFARRPGEDFLRRRLLGRHFSPLPGLQAPQYDGRGIAFAPDGRVAYWSARGLRHAAPARTRYEERGLVYGFALDSDADQNEWGTLVLDACIPDGTSIRVHCLTRDDLDYPDPLPRAAPAGEDPTPVALPEATPLPSTQDWVHGGARGQVLFRDPSPRPLAPPAADAFARHEAPVIAPPGRYLWLVFELAGTRSKTPRLRAARVAYPGHQLVRQLPRTLWREEAARDFLTRYLAPPAAMLDEWGKVSDQRHLLLDPRVTPAGALDWLGSLLGLAMDPCWPESACRAMLLETARLFRTRGSLGSLRRMIEILTGAQVIIIEHFRLRGGGVFGNPEAVLSNSVLGGGFRVGGSLGKEADTAIGLTADQAFERTAHRFGVTVVAALTDAQMACLRRLIDTHKPAHTDYVLCGISVGTRVGVGLHVGISSAIGRSSGFAPLTVGDAVLGKGYVLGRPELRRTGPGDGMGSCT